jgi:hypothetical protein
MSSRFAPFVLLASLAALFPSRLMAADAPEPGPVMPLVFEARASGELAGAADRVYAVAQRQARYLLGLVHPWSEDANLRLLTDSQSEEHWIRPNTGAVQGFCFLYRFGPYDEKVVGLARPALMQEAILPLMRYLTTTHLTGTRPTSDGKPWGDAWQSAHWAQMLGRGAWWVWDDLPDDVRQGVRRVVAHEADRIAGSEPPHRILQDTKAEENAWNAQILSVAVLLMPDDARRPAWETAFQRWVMSSFLRPADETSREVVDGRTVAEQFSGANVYDDFTLENHGFVHPDYMTTFSLSLGCALDYTLTGRRPPEALLFNTAGIYENLKWFLLPDGGFVYPSGQDWTLFRHPGWIHVHLLEAVYGGDPDAWRLALRSLSAMEKMQSRNASGAIFSEGEYFFPSTQTDRLASLACDWLILETASGVTDRFQERFGVRRLDAGKLILHRTPAMVNSVSWGAKVMAQPTPFRMDRIVSPDQRNGIGHVRLAGAKAALPITLREASVDNGDDWFEARLVLDHGQAVRAELRYRSDPDGAWTMSEKLVALEDVATAEIATGLVGILNNPHWIYERGRRQIEVDGRTHVLPAAGGSQFEAVAGRITIDGAMDVRIDPPTTIRYAGTSAPERGRVTDRLYLNYAGGERTWKTGQTISEYTAVVRRQEP